MSDEQKQKQRFLKIVDKKLNDRSYYKRHIKSRNFVEWLSYFFSLISVVFGITALYSLFMMMFGEKDTLLNMLSNNPLLSITALFLGIPILYLIEYLKHKFHTDGLQEKKVSNR